MKNKTLQNHIISVVTIIILLVLLCACKNSEIFCEEDDVCFILPQWPPAYGEQSLYPELLAWSITTNEARNQPVEASVQKIELTISKNKPFYLIAQPITKSSQGQSCFFHCAGGIYPYCYEHSGKKGTVKVSWEQGFNAYLMDSMLFSASSFHRSSSSKSDNENHNKSDSDKSEYENYLASFNWKKMVDTIQTKTVPESSSSEDFYNPWHTDLPAIKQGIAYKNFSATLLNQKNCFSVVLQDYGTNESVLSPYIPENEMIYNFSQFSLKKDEDNYFAVNNQYQMIIRGSSAKNLSIEYIFLPIIIEE